MYILNIYNYIALSNLQKKNIKQKLLTIKCIINKINDLQN